ncbi:MAG TPA: hypothetical protein VGE24_08025 [Emticicia sp.]
MKKILSIPVMLCMLFVACKKEANLRVPEGTLGNGPKEKLYPLKFTIGEFKQNFAKLSSATSDSEPLTKYISNLYYVLYDIDGSEIKRINYHSGDEGFGIITDTLPAGVYDAVLIGVNGDVLINGDRYGNETKRKLHEGAGFELSHGISDEIKAYDTFFARTTLNVEDEAVNSVISLERIVGGLEVNIQDALPKNACRVRVSLTGEHYIFNFGNERSSEPFLEANIIQEIKSAEKGKENYKINAHVLNTYRPMLVKISCYDENNNIIAEKTVANVKLERNKKLILTGKLFTPSPVTNGQVVYVNSDWIRETETVSF